MGEGCGIFVKDLETTEYSGVRDDDSIFGCPLGVSINGSQDSMKGSQGSMKGIQGSMKGIQDSNKGSARTAVDGGSSHKEVYRQLDPSCVEPRRRRPSVHSSHAGSSCNTSCYS